MEVEFQERHSEGLIVGGGLTPLPSLRGQARAYGKADALGVCHSAFGVRRRPLNEAPRDDQPLRKRPIYYGLNAINS